MGNQSERQRAILIGPERAGLRAVGEGHGLRRRIPSRFPGGGPAGDGFTRREGIRATREVVVIFGARANRGIREGLEEHEALQAADLFGRRLAHEALRLINRGDAQGELLGDDRAVEIERAAHPAVAVGAESGL